MKKYIVCIVALLLTACTNQMQDVPVLIYDLEDAYMDDYQQRMMDVGIEGVNLVVYDGQQSQTIQNEQIDDLLKKELPLLLVNPVDRLSAHAIIEKAKQQQASIIFFNREPLESDMKMYEKAYYVGADAIQSAQLQASLIMEMFGNNPQSLNQFDTNKDNIIQAVILKGQQGHQDAEQRTKYVVDSLLEEGYKVEVLEIAIANFDEQEGYQQMNRLVETFNDRIEVVISNNDAMALGAIRALVALEKIQDINNDGVIDPDNEPWIGVVGIDGLDRALAFLESNHLYGTIKNDSQEMVEIMLELTEWIIHEKDLNEFPYTIENGQYVWVDYQIIKVDD
jgi:methyl-galactoside transport system substrate-binding protein